MESYFFYLLLFDQKPNRMKKSLLFIVCALLAAATATAQVAQQGAKLSASQTEAFTKALATERTGAVLAYTGGGVALVSGAVWAISEASYRSSETNVLPGGRSIGIMGTVVGAAIAAGGLVTYLVGHNQVRLLRDRTTGSSQAELDLGFTPSGVGLALNF